jgi:hypothetical protein
MSPSERFFFLCGLAHVFRSDYETSFNLKLDEVFNENLIILAKEYDQLPKKYQSKRLKPKLELAVRNNPATFDFLWFVTYFSSIDTSRFEEYVLT